MTETVTHEPPVTEGSGQIVYLVNDHDCGQCGVILGVFGSLEKAEALIARYRAWDDDDNATEWPADLPYTSSISSLEVEEWEVD